MKRRGRALSLCKAAACYRTAVRHPRTSPEAVMKTTKRSRTPSKKTRTVARMVRKAAKTASRASAPARKRASGKRAHTKTPRTKSTSRKAAARKRGSARGTTKAARKTTAGTRSASKSARGSGSRKPAKTRVAASKTTARKSASTKKTSGTRRRGVSAAVARRHFRKLLEAKQARVRQGPSYPPANEFSGSHRASLATSAPPSSPLSPSDAPAVEGGSMPAHGRGNEGMRPQK